LLSRPGSIARALLKVDEFGSRLMAAIESRTHQRGNALLTYRTDRCTWLVWSLDGSPFPPLYAFQPLLGSQMRRNQMT
jgi:hypothetical protein